jgi:hypothetical protein
LRQGFGKRDQTPAIVLDPREVIFYHRPSNVFEVFL